MKNTTPQHSLINDSFTLKESESGVIRLQFLTPSASYDESTQKAEAIQAQVLDMLKKYGEGEALFLVELLENDAVVSSDANKIYKRMMSDKRILKMAIFGGLHKYRLLAKALLPLVMTNTVRVFDTKQQALAWLMTF